MAQPRRSVRIRERFVVSGSADLVPPSCFEMPETEGAEHASDVNGTLPATASPAHVAAG